jgi:hypothetical protein
MCISSEETEAALEAGTIKYMSSANLQILFKGDIGERSEAVITNEIGPIPEPCTTLAVIEFEEESEFENRVQCDRESR